MKHINLTQGQVAIVDDEDYEILSKLKWSVSETKRGTYYARHAKWISGKTVSLLMHRMIMKVEKGMYVDHINHNELDNRKTNLRICTKAQNNINKTGSGVSKYLGVSFLNGKFVATIYANKKQKYLGRFIKETDAAEAYNKAAKIYHGEFANLNIL